jgi:hypothetical protein
MKGAGWKEYSPGLPFGCTGSGRSISTFCTLARDSPEIHRRVRAPWPPGFGVLRQFARVLERHGPQKAQITRRKRVSFPSARIATYSAVHFLIPGISHNRFNKASESATFETDSSITHSPRESSDGLGSSPSQSDAGKLGVGKDLKCGE